MKPAAQQKQDTAHERSVRIRALLTGLAVVSAFAMPVQGQQWTSNGANIYFNGGNVGIGTATPAVPLQVYGTPTSTRMTLGTGQGTLDFSAFIYSVTGRGFSDISANLYADPDTVQWALRNSSYEGWITRVGRVTTDNSGTWQILHNNAGATTQLPFFTITGAGNVGIGLSSPQYKLAVEGAIGARDIIVTNAAWSDYVFRPGYRLRPLTEVASFIRQHGHLPEIPSEAEVNEKGVSVAEMQAKLLAKIEELTLHVIQQEKDNRELRERLAKVEKQTAGR